MDQQVLDRAVKIATRQALSGNPVARIVWIPPMSAGDDPRGTFVVWVEQGGKINPNEKKGPKKLCKQQNKK